MTAVRLGLVTGLAIQVVGCGSLSVTALHDPLYRAVAHVVVETGVQSVQSLARALVERLEERWKTSA